MYGNGISGNNFGLNVEIYLHLDFDSSVPLFHNPSAFFALITFSSSCSFFELLLCCRACGVKARKLICMLRISKIMNMLNIFCVDYVVQSTFFQVVLIGQFCKPRRHYLVLFLVFIT